MPDSLTKCNRPDTVHPDRWSDCDRCWVANCGYSRYTEPNPNWREQKGICRYEHCIERMPLHDPRDEHHSCPIFGHDCPGGSEAVGDCRGQKQRTDEFGSTATSVH